MPAAAPSDDKFARVSQILLPESIWNIDLSPDGKLLLAGGGADKTRIWDVQSGNRRHELVGGQGRFLPDGKVLTIAGSDGRCRLDDLAAGGLPREFGVAGEWQSNLWLAPDGKTAVALGPALKLRLWDLGAAKQLQSWTIGTEVWPLVIYSPDSRHVLVWTANKKWREWDLISKRETTAFGKVTARAGLVAMLPGSSQVVDCTGDSFTIFDVPTGNAVHRVRWQTTLAGDETPIAARLSRDLRRILPRTRMARFDSIY
jgi:WD40 repeat protein